MNVFYTTQEVAEILRVSTKTILNWAEEGKLPQPLVIGRVMRWPKEAIDNLSSEVSA